MDVQTDEQLLALFKQGLQLNEAWALRMVYDAGRLDGAELALTQPVEQIVIDSVAVV